MADGLIELENWAGDGFAQTVGDPIFMGILLLGFFFGFTMLQGLGFSGKLLILVPVAILAFPFIPFLPVFLGLVCAFILYLALAKMDNK
ncbi:MAG: hypothetical protein PHS46_08615 [Candidatus Omnitrophica bacterium]|nr:hypothetical protein [Candidatus Omnitrophota bacterium]